MVKEEFSNFKREPLIVYLSEEGKTETVYSYYVIKDGMISFNTSHNKITIPVARVIKIKEDKEE